MKNVIAVVIFAVIIASVLAGCGCAATPSDDSKSSASETMKVIETTADGGTVEKDSDGNSVQKDKDGKIVSVKDKNGKKLDVDEYVSTHPYAEKDYTGEKSGDSSSKTAVTSKSSKSAKSTSDSKSNSKSDDSKSGKTSSNNSKSNSSKSNSSKSDQVEGKIPSVVEDEPDDDDVVAEFPDM